MGRYKRKPYYVVTLGRKTGIYTNYELACKETDGVGKKPDGFETADGAYNFWLDSRPIERESTIMEVVSKSRGCCWYCGVELTTELDSKGSGHFDHQKPKSQQGGNGIDNLVLACHHCNVNQKGARDLEEYRTWCVENKLNFSGIFFGESIRETSRKQ